MLETPTITDLKALDLTDVPKKADSDKKKEAAVKEDTTVNTKDRASTEVSNDTSGGESQKRIDEQKGELLKNGVETDPEPRHVNENNSFDSEDDESDDDDDEFMNDDDEAYEEDD